LFVSKMLNYSVKEVPVVWVNSFETKLNPVKDSISMFFDLVKVRYNYILGRYD
jgi:hypothetical protein